MASIEITTQAELNALKKGDRGIVRAGYFVAWESAHVEARESAHVEAWGSAHVEAWESAHVVAWESAHVVARGSAHVEAWGSAHVVAWGSAHVEARGSAHVVARESAHVEARESAHVEARESAHVEAWGSAHVVAWESAHVVARESAHVEAWGNAHVEAWGSAHVVAWESAHVEAWGSAHVVASQYVAIHRHSPASVVVGGTVIEVKRPVTPIEWAAFYGAKLDGATLLLYKAVRADYRSAHGFLYQPGTTVAAPDWNGDGAECGGGLHFSPHPAMALEFDPAATRFVACPVALEDIRAPQPKDDYPQKLKARRTCGPIFEVDRAGRPVADSKRKAP